MRHKGNGSDGLPPERSLSRGMRPEKTALKAGAAAPPALALRLYVAESGPNSMQAVANLQAICKEYLKDNYRLEIVDVLKYPHRALADGVVVTPSLAKVFPSPAVKVVGNLSDRRSVLRALGIKG